MDRPVADTAPLEMTACPVRFLIGGETIAVEGKCSVQKRRQDTAGVTSLDYLVMVDRAHYAVHPDDIPYVDDLIRQLDTGGTVQFEFGVTDLSGHSFTLSGTARRATHLHTPTTSRASHPHTTLTDTLHTPPSSHVSNAPELLDTLVHTIPQGCYVLDQHGHFLLVNAKAADLLRQNNNTLIHQHIWSVLPHAADTAYYEAVQVQALDNRQPAQLRYHDEHRGVWVNLTAQPTANGCMVLLEEESKGPSSSRALIEEHHALLESNALLEAMAQSQVISLNALKAIRDDNGHIVDLEWTFANTVGEAYAGGVKLKGRRFLDVFPTSVETGSMDIYRSVIETGQTREHELFYDADGLHGWFRSVAVKLGDGILITGEDITARRQAERELLAVKDELARRATNRYLELVKNMQQAFCIVEVLFDKAGNAIDYRFLETNPAFEKQSKLKNAVGKRMRDIEPRLEEIWFKTYGDVVKTQQSVHFTQSARFLGDAWFEVFALPTGAPGSNKVAIFFTDVTARKRAEKNAAFLAEIQDDFAKLTAAGDIMELAGSKVSAYLHASIGYLGDIAHEEEMVTLYARVKEHDGDNDPSTPHRYRLRTFVNEEVMAAWQRGEPVVVCDVGADPRMNAAAYASRNIFSFISIPFHQRDEVTALLVAYDSKVRDWRDDEIALFGELSNRIFPRLERARAEEALRESEEKYRTLFDAMAEGYVLVDVHYDRENRPVELVYVEANAAAVRMAGTDLVGKPATGLMPNVTPDDYPIFSRVALAGIGEHHEFATDHDETVFYYYIFKPPTAGDDQVAAVFSDITQRKIAERKMKAFSTQLEREVSARTQELKQSKDLLQSLFDSTTNGISVLKAVRDDQHNIIDFEYVFVNKTAEQIKKRTDLIGKRYGDIHTGARQSGMFDNLKRVVETGEIGMLELYYDYDGFQNWFGTSAVKFGDGVVLSFEDVSVRKRAEQELSKNYEIMRHAEIVAGLGSWEYNLETREFKWSEGMYKLFDLPPGTQVTPEVYKTFVAQGSEHLADRVLDFFYGDHAPLDIVLPIQTSRQSKCLKVKGVLINDATGKPVRLIGIDHDITAQEKSRRDLEALNESLQQKNIALRSMNEELANFAFITSHDLREPLRKIKTFGNFLIDREASTLSPRGQDYCQRIVTSADRMNALIDDILMFSKANAGEQKFSSVNLNQVLDDVVTDLGELIAESGAIITADPLPAIEGNALQLSQLFQNLISNGIKFQARGNTPRIVIGASIVRGEEVASPLAVASRSYFLVKVADNGIGFEVHYTEKIFQMFQRLHSHTEYKGTGMGLAICKRVMENHKGFMLAESVPGQGATFYCYFPATQQPA